MNVAPSLSSSSPYDKKVKTMLLSDTMHLMGYNIFDRKRIEDERHAKKGNSNIGALGKNDFKKSKSTKDDTNNDDEGISPIEF